MKTSKNLNCLLTGSRGFIGSHLKKKLELLGHNVTGIDLVNGTDILTEPRHEVDVIYHLAARTDVSSSFQYAVQDAGNNILTTVKLLRLYPDKRIIYTNSSAARTPISPYGLSKKTAEEYIKLLSKNYVICNLPNVYGDGGHGVIEKWLKTDKPILYGTGEQVRTFVHVSDITDALVRALRWDKGIYDLGGTKPINMNQLLHIMSKKQPLITTAPEGEIQKSIIKNTTPNWKPKIKLTNYIR